MSRDNIQLFVLLVIESIVFRGCSSQYAHLSNLPLPNPTRGFLGVCHTGMGLGPHLYPLLLQVKMNEAKSALLVLFDSYYDLRQV